MVRQSHSSLNLLDFTSQNSFALYAVLIDKIVQLI